MDGRCETCQIVLVRLFFVIVYERDECDLGVSLQNLQEVKRAGSIAAIGRIRQPVRQEEDIQA